MPSFFLSRAPIITVLLLTCFSYMIWGTRFFSLKLCMGFSIFNSVSFLLKFIVFFNKKHGHVDFKTSYFLYLNKNNRRVTHSFAPIPLIFKLQQEVLKFNDICLSWSSLKADVVISFLNLENRSFENVSFSRDLFSMVTFKKIFDISFLKNIH